MANAILMASGLGTRMRPLTNTVPKPLINVCGTPMIETVISGLKKANVEKIYVVVGYLGEQFEYLPRKYSGLYIINNPDYRTVNNISSVYYACDILEKSDCYICEADLYISDNNIFNKKLNTSCYFGKMVEGYSDDWVFDVDKQGFITRVGKVGVGRYNMVGISYFEYENSKILASLIREAYGRPGYEDLFWDDIVNINLAKLKLRIHPVGENQIVEIDTIEELEKIENEVKNGSR